MVANPLPDNHRDARRTNAESSSEVPDPSLTDADNEDPPRGALPSAHFRAVAVDFDGTLAEGPVAPDMLVALAEARARGIWVILMTGRIMSELRSVFPEVDNHVVDAVVAENGALVVAPVGVRTLAAPVDRAVSGALTASGSADPTGQVLIACAAADEPAALDVVRGLGLDC